MYVSAGGILCRPPRKFLTNCAPIMCRVMFAKVWRNTDSKDRSLLPQHRWTHRTPYRVHRSRRQTQRPRQRPKSRSLETTGRMPPSSRQFRLSFVLSEKSRRAVAQGFRFGTGSGHRILIGIRLDHRAIGGEARLSARAGRPYDEIKRVHRHKPYLAGRRISERHKNCPLRAP